MLGNSKKASASNKAKEKSSPATNHTATKGSPSKAAYFAWIKLSKGAVSKTAPKVKNMPGCTP